MIVLHVAALLVFTFGVYVSASVLVYALRSALRPDSGPAGLRRALRACHARPAVRWNVVLLCLCCVWFTLHSIRELMRPDSFRTWLDLVRLLLSLGFPPILMQTTYHEVREGGSLTHRGWRLALVLGWIVSPLVAVIIALSIFRIAPRPLPIGALIGYSLGLAYSIAGVYCALALSRGRKKRETTDERKGRRWMVALYCALLLFAAAIAVVPPDSETTAALLYLAGGSIPLVFMFTGTYHESRFEFVDLFVKRGVFFVLCIFLLVAFFGLILPGVEALRIGAERSWARAVILLPLALLLPWIHRRLGRWLDSVWLGRTLPPVEAIKRFLAGLRDAVTREQLADQAERGLAAIFRAPVRVCLERARSADEGFEADVEVPVRSGGAVVGSIRLGRRENHVPYFGEDLTLIDSLADVLSHMLENVDLQERRQEQETRTSELSLQASRSELKALRAQINPHFLFNALNAIAGLIHKDPARADETLEQLAEIFRYTLRGSESEWAVLTEELDFVRSYLEVERARFGERLGVRVDAADDVVATRLPTMMIQTLVENAVKHGVATVRGPARIEIAVRREDDFVVVDVADSGPGFPESGDAARPSLGFPGARGVGYGLRNVRERLAGYYGGRARIVIRRDTDRSMTVVSLVLPAEPPARTRAGDDAPATQAAP